MRGASGVQVGTNVGAKRVLMRVPGGCKSGLLGGCRVGANHPGCHNGRAILKWRLSGIQSGVLSGSRAGY